MFKLHVLTLISLLLLMVAVGCSSSGEAAIDEAVSATLLAAQPATRNGNFDLPELIEYLLRAMTFSWHFCLPSFCPLSDLSDGHV